MICTLWFNPPFNLNVETNIGRWFLTLVKNCFPRHHPLHKICNRNTLKLSYSCLPNMGRLVQISNRKKKISAINDTRPDGCSCADKTQCPVDGNCKQKGVIYQARVASEKQEETYIRLACTDFKTRFLSARESTPVDMYTECECIAIYKQLAAALFFHNISWSMGVDFRAPQ